MISEWLRNNVIDNNNDIIYCRYRYDEFDSKFVAIMNQRLFSIMIRLTHYRLQRNEQQIRRISRWGRGLIVFRILKKNNEYFNDIFSGGHGVENILLQNPSLVRSCNYEKVVAAMDRRIHTTGQTVKGI